MAKVKDPGLLGLRSVLNMPARVISLSDRLVAPMTAGVPDQLYDKYVVMKRDHFDKVVRELEIESVDGDFVKRTLDAIILDEDEIFVLSAKDVFSAAALFAYVDGIRLMGELNRILDLHIPEGDMTSYESFADSIFEMALRWHRKAAKKLPD